MHTPAAQGIEVLVEDLLDMDQGALPGTVRVVLQRGDHDDLLFPPFPRASIRLPQDTCERYSLRKVLVDVYRVVLKFARTLAVPVATQMDAIEELLSRSVA